MQSSLPTASVEAYHINSLFIVRIGHKNDPWVVTFWCTHWNTSHFIKPPNFVYVMHLQFSRVK